jgi:ABC-type transport system involved in multi-copper enzyme maturation permease subunit
MTQNFIQTIWTVANKEMRIHFKTRRLLVIGIIFAAVFIIISIWGGYITGQNQDEPSYEEGAENVIIMVLAFSSIFPAILAIALTYDSIVGEKVNNSMYLLISKPIKKEALYLGKFLGAWISIAMVYLGVMTVGYLIIIGLSGQIPSGKDVAMVYVAVFFILLGVAAWISLIMLCSTVFKTIASTLITSILVWLFVLSLLSLSGLIYWAVTAPSADETSIHVSYLPSSGDDFIVIATSFNPERDPGQIELILKDDNGTVVGIGKSSIGNRQASVTVPPGNYTWEVTDGGVGSKQEIYENGMLLVRPGNMLSSSIKELDEDSLFNDYEFALLDETTSPLIGGHYILSKNGQEVKSGDVSLSIVNIKNLTKGWYVFKFIIDDNVIIEDKVYSYGDITLGGGMFFMTQTDSEEVPAYVKIMYAINPDNNIGAYAYFLNEDHEGLLSLSESTAALVVFMAVCGTSGILLFKKKDLI